MAQAATARLGTRRSVRARRYPDIPRDYNFAADILSRNLKAGRANKPVFIDSRGSWTYGQLADRVGALRRDAARARHPARGAHPYLHARHHRLADRVSGRAQGRRDRGRGQHAADRERLRIHADRQPREDAGRLAGAVPKFAPILKRCPTSNRSSCPAARAAHTTHSKTLIAACEAGGLHRADHARRHRLLALFLGLDRQAQGRRARQASLQLTDDLYAGADPRHHRERRLLLGRQAVLRLRSRQRHDLPDVGRRHHRAAGRPSDARRRCGASAQAPGHGFLRRADLLCGVPRKPGMRLRRNEIEIPPLRLRRRGAAGRKSAGAGRRNTAATFSTASARPRCCISFCRTVRTM